MPRYLPLLLSTILIVSCARSTAFHEFHRANKNDTEFAMGAPSFLVNLLIPRDDYREYKPLLKKARFHKIMVFENTDGKVHDRFDAFIKGRNITKLMEVQDSGSGVELYFVKKKDLIKEIMISIEEEDEFILYGLKTKMTEEQLYKTINEVKTKLDASSKTYGQP